VNVLGVDLTGVIDAEFIDQDPFVRIDMPQGAVVEQNLIGTHTEGDITCNDYKGILRCFYQTAIPENLGFYPINPDNIKTNFSTQRTSPEFYIVFEDNEKTEYYFLFYNVKIRTINMQKSSTSGTKEATWIIKFMADYYYYNGSTATVSV
jgi:hypothetical protein